MAFCLFSSFPMCSFPIHSKWKSFSYNRSSFRRLTIFSALQSDAANKNSTEDAIITRRSANYHPPIWDYGYVQSLRNDFVEDESYKEQARKLKEEVRMMLGNVVDPLEKLELIDTLQRLGLSYHFEAEINKTLKNISTNHISTAAWKKDNLYATALEFRLLRQHGYKVDQEVFTCFMDDVGNIKSSPNQDFKGLLNLYEASYLLLEGETMLENARELVSKLLKQYLKENNDHQYLWTLVDHALELPLHWRMPRLEARWFIEAYEKNKDRNPIVLELAILDYNIVQSMHQEDLRNVSTWWKELGIGQRFSFARDRLMENFLWGAGMIIAPQDGKSRIILTKVNALITVIDDVYDVYGTLDELELFTDVVERWDINEIQRLPDYMKIYYHALYNSVNEMAFDTIKEQGIDVIPFLKKVWTDLCKAYLVEAKWYYIGYTPTLKEYIDNAWISIGCYLMLAHAYLVTSHITEEGLHNIQENYIGVYQPSIITRLSNDLGTSSYELKRGDVPKSVQCYMYESGASEEEAREHIRKLIDAAWKKINEDQMAKLPFSPTFIESTKNIARVSLLMYQNGDGHGHGMEDKEYKKRVLSLFAHPISLAK
ncbi:terpene synthase 10-like [Gossypium arboreum]|uniref:terpene synthase 10-like n=1 Tax=Gossypium arboreum TaxID=29729 RepID=UPI000818FE84|nr:terpene synthase 10-like [Gossypium arboreum]